MYQSVSIQFNSFQPMPVSDVSLAGLRSASVAKIDAMPSQVCDSPHLPLIGFREGRLRNSSSSAALFRPLHLVREPRGSNSFVLRRGTPSATQDQGPGSCQTEDGFAVHCNSFGMRSGSRNISSIKLVALFQGSGEGSLMPLDVKYAVNGWGILCLQQSYRDVAHGDSGRCLAIKSSMVGVAMYHKVSAVSVYHLSQSRAAEEGEDFPGFTVHRFGDRRIMHHYNSLRGAQL
jgi:hypothetical protein